MFTISSKNNTFFNGFQNSRDVLLLRISLYLTKYVFLISNFLSVIIKKLVKKI